MITTWTRELSQVGFHRSMHTIYIEITSVIWWVWASYSLKRSVLCKWVWLITSDVHCSTSWFILSTKQFPVTSFKYSGYCHFPFARTPSLTFDIVEVSYCRSATVGLPSLSSRGVDCYIISDHSNSDDKCVSELCVCKCMLGVCINSYTISVHVCVCLPWSLYIWLVGFSSW